MKSLDLTLKERLLIVEDYVTGNLDVYYENYRRQNPGKYLKFICKGPELTEEIAIQYVHHWFNDMTDELFCRDYNSAIIDNLDADNALQSFISAVESASYHWGENESLKKYRHVPNSRMFKEAESRTFHPSKTLIFKII